MSDWLKSFHESMHTIADISEHLRHLGSQAKAFFGNTPFVDSLLECSKDLEKAKQQADDAITQKLDQDLECSRRATRSLTAAIIGGVLQPVENDTDKPPFVE